MINEKNFIMTEISLVVPVLNEELSIALFIEKVQPILESITPEWEIVFVDDGSKDKTVEIVLEQRQKDSRICLVELSRNFGKEAALTAGLEWSNGKSVIPMDVDLQDPPELIIEFHKLWKQGFDVVLGQRVSRDNDTGTKRASAGAFYKVFNKISEYKIEPNVGDYRLMSRQVVDETLKLREKNRFMKGIFAWVGFKTASVPYERPERAAGTGKFNYWKLWNFALDGITGFSTVPLRIWTYVGGIIALASLAYLLWLLVDVAINGNDVPGYASLMSVILLLGSVQLISLGILGEYVGRMYKEVKARPIYIARRVEGCSKTDA
jgi:glycosyltransferase involved in cell wall biosynthesis